MHRQVGMKLLLLAGCMLALGLAASPSQASYDFELVTLDYAAETSYWGVATLQMLCTNTGTQRDSLRFSISQDAPSGWFSDYCLKGKCYFGPAWVVFDAGESETVYVEIYVDDVPDMGLVTLTVYMKSAPAVTHSETVGAWNQIPSVLIVDDDAGQTYQTYLANALQNAGYPGRVWDANSLGRPSPVLLNSHWMVFWTTGGGDASYLTTSDEGHLASFLDQGGKLFLASADFLSSRSAASDFTDDYLHIASWTNDTGGNPMTGVSGDPISDGMSLDLSGGPLPVGSSDSFTLGAPAESTFSCATGLKGLRVEQGNHKVVFLAFPFENVGTGAAPNNQNTLIANVMAYFDPPVAGVPDATEPGVGLALRQLSTNPFRAAATLAFNVPGGSRDAHIGVYDVSGRLVKLLHVGAVGSSETLVTWDGTDLGGAPVSAGVYFCRLSANGGVAVTKLLRLD
jgi:hypothetical protein